GRIIFLTMPYKEWMDDSTYKQQKMINLFLDVVRQGQKEGILDPDIPKVVALDFMWGVIHRVFTMWIYRGQKESLTGNVNQLFEMIWRGITKAK
ncbi:unnamed protein product, partial [marine sediment metagenome]